MHERRKKKKKKQANIFMSDKTIKKIHCAGLNVKLSGTLNDIVADKSVFSRIPLPDTAAHCSSAPSATSCFL